MKITTHFLKPNKYSRPQIPMRKIKAIVIHWVANPNSSAISNRNYFNNLRFQPSTKQNPVYASAHEIIGLDGEVILAIPENEVAYHVGSKTYTNLAKSKLGSYPNNCTYGIECTHIDLRGKMTNETYLSLVERVAVIAVKHSLSAFEDILLHKEIVGWKDCHKYFVSYPDRWQNFKQDVHKKMQELQNDNINIDGPDPWKVEALKSLHEAGLIKNFDLWVKRLDEKATVWLVFVLANNIYQKLKKEMR